MRLRFWQEKRVLRFWQENTFFFLFWRENADFGGKYAFCGFVRKTRFLVLAEKRVFAILARKRVFVILAGKTKSDRCNDRESKIESWVWKKIGFINGFLIEN